MENRNCTRYWLPRVGKEGGGLILEKPLLKSPAFRGLSGLAVHIYILLWMEARNVNSEPRRKKARYYVINNGEIKLTYAQIEEKLGMKIE